VDVPPSVKQRRKTRRRRLDDEYPDQNSRLGLNKSKVGRAPARPAKLRVAAVVAAALAVSASDGSAANGPVPHMVAVLKKVVAFKKTDPPRWAGPHGEFRSALDVRTE
jgi:hypothetical protein